MAEYFNIERFQRMLENAVAKHDKVIEEAIFSTTQASAIYNNTLDAGMFAGMFTPAEGYVSGITRSTHSWWRNQEPQAVEDSPADDVQDVDFE